MDQICWAVAILGWTAASVAVVRVRAVNRQMSDLQVEFEVAKSRSILLIDRATEETRSAANAYREATEAIARARYALENVK